MYHVVDERGGPVFGTHLASPGLRFRVYILFHRGLCGMNGFLDRSSVLLFDSAKELPDCGRY